MLLQLNELPALVSKYAFSCTHRSKKVRDPELRAAGTECLQASQCTLLLPEVSRGSRPAASGSFLVHLPFEEQTLIWLPGMGRALGQALGDGEEYLKR